MFIDLGCTRPSVLPNGAGTRLLFCFPSPHLCSPHNILDYFPYPILQTLQHLDGINVPIQALQHLYGINMYCIRPAVMLVLGQWVEQCNQPLSSAPLLATQCLAFATNLCTSKHKFFMCGKNGFLRLLM